MSQAACLYAILWFSTSCVVQPEATLPKFRMSWQTESSQLASISASNSSSQRTYNFVHPEPPSTHGGSSSITPGSSSSSSSEAVWECWQLPVLDVVGRLLHVLAQLGLITSSCSALSSSTTAAAAAGAVDSADAADAADAAAAAAADADSLDAAATNALLTISAVDNVAQSSADDSGGARTGDESGNSSTSCTGAASVRWGYLLLQLQQSKGWAEAAAAFDSKWPDALRVLNAALADQSNTGTAGNIGSSSSSSTAVGASSSQQQQQQPSAQDDISQMYADALQLCRALVAAAPLPLVCNNPSCDNLAGASETAVATKLCAGCRCRYCSAACQAADWRRHRKGCKAMTAAGLAAS
jgi:hypothetical protein